jgi:hypothetical protein
MPRMGDAHHSSRWLLAAAIALALTANACTPVSSADSTHPAAGSSGPTPFLPGLSLPPDVEQRLIDVQMQLADAFCTRAKNCCGKFGFKPLSDCTSEANSILAPNVLSSSEVEGDVRVWIDERMVTACLAGVTALENDCTFARDGGADPYLGPHPSACGSIFQYARADAAVTGLNCSTDDQCDVEFDGGYTCLPPSCVPEVRADVDGSCSNILDTATNTFYGCVPGAMCNGDFCVPLAAPGEVCGAVYCQDGYNCDVYVDGGNEVDLCTAGIGVGMPVASNRQCADGLAERCADGGGSCVCVGVAAYGDLCTPDSECQSPSYCDGGVCMPWALPGLCQ